MADTVAAALRQIKEKAYDTELAARGIAGNESGIMGLLLRGKRC